jgi:predicted signal transduction protein with EAL and GGDEF domain
LTLARRLGRLIKPQDTLARLAGDQFGMILLSERDSARITAFAENIRKTLRAPITFRDREILLTASIGMALGNADAQNGDEVLKDAELAMYHAKRTGGDRIDVFKDAMRARKSDRLSVESDLRRALERDEIAILYQPIVRLEDRAIAGFEALARWSHPRLGRLSPPEFINIAEETGLIVELGLFVLDRTARQLSTWQRTIRHREPLFASVNVSSRQLLRHDLIQDLRTVLARAPLTRGSLKLELTESVVMENPEHAAQMLHRIRELGAGLALDDFGTGYSSLAQLADITADELKIDRSFITDIHQRSRSQSILKAIEALSESLGMTVIAEGVETGEEAAYLTGETKIRYAQGFYYSKPIFMEELTPTRGGAGVSRSLAAPRERSVARGGLTRR